MTTIFLAVGYIALALLGINLFILVLRLIFVPLAIWHQVRVLSRRKAGNEGAYDKNPSVSVIVPAYNEEVTLENCVSSIIGCEYKNLEILIVDDGSSDDTESIGRRLASENTNVRFIRQENAGKGAALNTGYKESHGEFLLCIDSDSVFTEETIPEMLRGFYTPRVGAVCGDDRPVNLNRILTRFLALITYVGTGLVRRAFDVLGAMPVVSGNSGAFRRTALADVSVGNRGPFREDTMGEDLELTWRIHRARWQVVFAPKAVVFAESPSSISALWRQRVRWARGLLQSFRWHASALVRSRNFSFCFLMWFTLVSMIFLPVAQIISLIVVSVWFIWRLFNDSAATEPAPYWTDAWLLLVASGLALSLILLLISMALGNGLKDLRHIWTAPIWPIYSTAISLTMLRALYLESARRPQIWNKPKRTGVISIGKQKTQDELEPSQPQAQAVPASADRRAGDSAPARPVEREK